MGHVSGISIWENNLPSPHLISYNKLNSEYVSGLNVNDKIIKLLEESWTFSWSLRIQKVLTLKGKIYYDKLYLSKDTNKIMKEVKKWEKIFVIPIANKGLIWNVLIILQSNKKKTGNSVFLKTRQKT